VWKKQARRIELIVSLRQTVLEKRMKKKRPTQKKQKTFQGPWTVRKGEKEKMKKSTQGG